MNIDKIYHQEPARWRAKIVYRVTNDETRTAIHNFWEISELDQIVESGPTWCAIESFNIEYCGPKETIKESMEA